MKHDDNKKCLYMGKMWQLRQKSDHIRIDIVNDTVKQYIEVSCHTVQNENNCFIDIKEHIYMFIDMYMSMSYSHVHGHGDALTNI